MVAASARYPLCSLAMCDEDPEAGDLIAHIHKLVSNNIELFIPMKSLRGAGGRMACTHTRARAYTHTHTR